MPVPPVPDIGYFRPLATHLDNPHWQDGGSCGPFAGRPVEVRNGIPWKPYRRGERRHWWAERTRQQIEREA